MKPRLRFLFFVASALSFVTPARATTPTPFTGDVTDVRVIRHMEKRPGASLLWEPYLAQWKGRHLVAAFGAGIPGKTDMGDILASVSTDDGDTWSDPVFIFDHNQRHGALQFAYANAILYKPPGQDVLWAFGMRCPLNYRNSEDAQLVGAYSADGGRSWNPVELSMHYTMPLIVVAGIHRIVENGVPRYLFPAHRNTLRYKTKPPGGAWSAEKTFYDAGIKNSYPTLIEVAPGDFRAVWDRGTKDRTRAHIQFGKFKVKADAR